MNISPLENLRLAADAIWSHRFRSMLTILGIVIGITTVVTVSSLLTGLRKGIVTFFEEFGPDNILSAVSAETLPVRAHPKSKSGVRCRPLTPITSAASVPPCATSRCLCLSRALSADVP